MNPRLAIALALLGALLCVPAAAVQPIDRDALRARARSILGVLPAEAKNPENPGTEAKVELGRMLYYDARLSKNQDVSCNSCPDLTSFGVDGQPTSPGHRGQRGSRNSPTVYNAALHVAQFWDGRARDLEEQAGGPILNPIEMAMPSEAHVLRLLRSIPDYPPLFAAAFPSDADPLTYANLTRAIAAFERELLTPDRFDAFLEGDDDALSDTELAGLEAFIEAGCISCHMGPGVGGTLYRPLGQVVPYPTQDVGRMAVTNEESDRGVFKVPSLRNVAKTGPYFHDGSVTTLGRAILLMGEHQLGRTLDAAEVASIRSFLGALTGAVDPALIARPQLPPSGPDTPAPDPS